MRFYQIMTEHCVQPLQLEAIAMLAVTIPQELEQLLFCISKRIPLCIISSKDFAFLHKRTRFANILSCVLGMETIVHNSHYKDKEIKNFGCISTQHLIASSHFLMDNSKLLHNIVKIFIIKITRI